MKIRPRCLWKIVLKTVRVALQYFSPQAILPDPSKLKFSRDLEEFVRLGGNVSILHPVLNEFSDNAAILPGHYFNQDLLVASLIAEAKPRRHIDVGSSIAGFVAHVASFREIEILDIRPLAGLDHPQITFLQRDLMAADPNIRNITDSLSCLHTIEHFGLGRYGDQIDPEGHLKGFQNLVDMIEPGGTLYISFPIGTDNAVHFNAHRVFHPLSILDWPLRDGPLTLKEFSFEDDSHKLHKDVPLDASVPDLIYGCGIYSFQKE